MHVYTEARKLLSVLPVFCTGLSKTEKTLYQKDEVLFVCLFFMRCAVSACTSTNVACQKCIAWSLTAAD